MALTIGELPRQYGDTNTPVRVYCVFFPVALLDTLSLESRALAIARAQAVAEYQLKQALELGAAWVASSRKAGNTAEIEQATSAFFELAELACKHGVQLPGYTLEPSSRLDARILTDLVNAVRPKRRNGLHVVASNGKRVDRSSNQG